MENSKKKILLIFPPQWTPISPYFSIPQLAGQIKNAGFRVETMDLNIEFFNDLLTPGKIQEAIIKSKLQFEMLNKKIRSTFVPNKKAQEYTFEEQILIYSYSKIKKFIQTNQNSDFITKGIEEAKNNLKNENFYNPKIFIKSLNIIDNALEILSIPYTPTKIEFEGVQNPFFKFNLDTIKYFVFHEQSNIFLEYYKTRLDEILKKNADFIAISLNSSSQIIPSLTLTNLLKQKTKAHINIGGNFFGRISEELLKHKDFFEIFADSVSIEEGEGPIVEVAKFANDIIQIEEVPNLIYLKEGKVIQNPKMKPVKLNNMANMDLTDYKLDKYLSPKIVLPYQSSRGCYWGKCSFCDQAFGQNLNVKNPQKVVDELKELKQKYNIDCFEFIDESVSPVNMEAISNEIIKSEIKVSFITDARLENDFTPDILQKASKAGLKMALWGLESGSRPVMDLINKGVDFEKRFDVLKNAKKAGIWNFAFIFFGFPSETQEDAKLTIQMLADNSDIIDSYGRSVYTMGRHSKLAEDPMKYGITKIYPAEDEFSPNIKFDCKGMTQQELHQILELCFNASSKVYNNPLWMYLRTREYLFLYIEKNGVDWVKNYKI